jgi:hypothetical protein
MAQASPNSIDDDETLNPDELRIDDPDSHCRD